MRLPRVTACVIAATVCAGSAFPAHAFMADQHRSITTSLCQKAGLPQQFCERVGIEAANVDGDEWDDLVAHAQGQPGTSMCASASAVLARLASLGDEHRAALAALAATPSDEWYDYYKHAASAARALGRALHTLQDNRAHQGMWNPQHAWFSLGEVCHELTSPDSNVAALETARDDTAGVLHQVATEIKSAGVSELLGMYSCQQSTQSYGDSGSVGDQACAGTSSPTPWDACEFLEEAGAWDGIDRRWNDSAVDSGGIEAFFGGTVWDMCEVSNLPVKQRPAVDVSEGPPTCTKMSVLCFGEVSEHVELAPPNLEGGCSVGGHADGALLLAGALLLLAGALLRRGSAPRG